MSEHDEKCDWPQQKGTVLEMLQNTNDSVKALHRRFDEYAISEAKRSGFEAGANIPDRIEALEESDKTHGKFSERVRTWGTAIALLWASIQGGIWLWMRSRISGG